MSVGVVQAVFTTNTSSWSAGCAKAGKDLDGVKGKHDSFVQSLKHGLGKESTFGSVMEMMKGAGAVMGLTLAGRSLNAMATGANKLRQELSEGTINAGQLFDKLASSVPVFGEFYAAGQQIRELFTGEQAYFDQTAKSVERLNKQMADGAVHAGKMREIMQSIAQYTANSKFETMLLGVDSDFERKRLETRQKAQQENADLEAKRLLERKVPLENKLLVDLTTRRDELVKIRDTNLGLYDVSRRQVMDQSRFGKTFDDIGYAWSNGINNGESVERLFNDMLGPVLSGRRLFDMGAANIAATNASAELKQVNKDLLDQERLTREKIAEIDQKHADAKLEREKKLAAEIARINKDAGEAVAKSVQTPAEKYAERIKELDGLLKGGALNPDLWQRAVGAAQSDFLSANGSMQYQAMNAKVRRFQFGELTHPGMVAGGGLEGLIRVSQQGNTEQARTNTLIEQTNRIIQEGLAFQVVGVNN